MKRKRSTEGFTLFELAVALLIMGSMAALAAPGLGEMMADSRASAATEELVRLHRVIRARVNETGLAHLLTFSAASSAAGSSGLGQLRLYEGMNNRCRQTPWMQTINGTPAQGHTPIEIVDLASSQYNLAPASGAAVSDSDTGRHVVTVRADADATAAILCFEPGGTSYVGATDGTSAAIGFTFTPQITPVIFTVRRTITMAGGTKESRGVDRQVIFPAGGNGRFRL
jgi:prepilin-type N-terminal cleavage/methylation domain-containing protein